MSTRCYDTDLNAAAWAWIAPYLPAAGSGGRPRTTDLRAVLDAIFYLRVPAPGHQGYLRCLFIFAKRKETVGLPAFGAIRSAIPVDRMAYWV